MASKRTAVGVAQRLHALRRSFPTIEPALAQGPERVPIDDALDAVAAAWSAGRIARGEATTYGPCERDDQDLPLGIKI